VGKKKGREKVSFGRERRGSPGDRRRKGEGGGLYRKKGGRNPSFLGKGAGGVPAAGKGKRGGEKIFTQTSQKRKREKKSKKSFPFSKGPKGHDEEKREKGCYLTPFTGGGKEKKKPTSLGGLKRRQVEGGKHASSNTERGKKEEEKEGSTTGDRGRTILSAEGKKKGKGERPHLIVHGESSPSERRGEKGFCGNIIKEKERRERD